MMILTPGVFCREKPYPLITLEALAGFSEDQAAARCFTRRFLPWSLSCIAAILCIVAFILIPIYRGQGDDVPHIYGWLVAASFFVAGVLFVKTWRRMVDKVPISPRSGLPMEVYRLEDSIKEGKYELVYLCRQSRTFFRMVFKAPEY